MAIISPIALATKGYVCDSKIEPIALATRGFLCVEAVVVAAVLTAVRRTIQFNSLRLMARRR